MKRWMDLSVTVLVLFVGLAAAHVRLTWPPARTFDFDFLDNIRTEVPCGMPSGGPVSTFAPGQKVNVTWHLAYSHRGGYKLFIIPRNGSEIMAHLTTEDEWVGTNETGTIMHEVEIPSNIEGDYTLVLNRNAAEWVTGNPNLPFYTFHSCADITITAGVICNTNMECSGNGQCTNNKCVCEDLASGDFCQYVDECMNEDDCSNHGECMEVSDVSYTYPRYVCFCSDGYFGQHCEMENPSDFKVDMTMEEMSSYYHRDLSDSMSVYFTVLTATNEVEVIVKSTGKGWIGFGWRPSGMDGTCRNFPVAYTSGAVPEGEPEGEPGAEPEPTAAGRRRRRSVRSVRIPRDSDGGGMDMDDECIPWGSGGAEPGASAEPEPEAEPTAEPGAVPTAGPTLEPGATAEPAAEGEPEGEPEAPAAALHPMDCMDIVIGMVDGGLSRVGDYYTRDRSTPRRDSFYGGMESLTAAGGKEYNDRTIVKFRRKLTSTERSDHSIMNGPMTVIFARGQDYGRYVHNPPSGVEHCTTSQRFYKRFELKYHGTAQSQRGQVPNFNFYEDPNAPPQTGPCNGDYSMPMNCQGDACDYKITWTFREADDKIQFNIVAKTESNRWTGVGFSKQGAMVGSDAVIAFNGANGVVVEDRFLGGKSANTVVIDDTNNLEEVSASYDNGIMTVAFRRPRDTGDNQDVAFTDDPSGCLHLLIPTQGGTFTEGTPNMIGYHAQTPMVVPKVCIKACDEGPGTGDNSGTNLSARLSTVLFIMVLVFILKM
ncbi:uncharacterized protein LOC119737611 [Patiria miniata]|uniref:Uncharacterized protein n=1 Tax=Patiria miniata TaxID=46514 RepID=A0A914AV78_PATMI|nr:uncharacterized protein LOC119737611 [Patiria miniata]